MFKAVFKTALFVVFLFLLCAYPGKVYAATYTVTKTADTNDGTCDSDCSLREAIASANSNSGNDTIEFNIPTSDGGYVPASGSTQAYWNVTTATKISLTDDSGVYINGYSQPGSGRNTAAFGETINTVLTIDLYVNLSTDINLLISGDNNHITGLNIRALRTAGASSIYLDSSSNNFIEGNFFGSNINGTAASEGGSISMNSNSASNIIGTNGDGDGDVGERNLFAGNTTGNSGSGGYIRISSGNSNKVSGNYLGTDITGRSCTTKTLNGMAIEISSANNIVGTNYDGVSDSEESNLLGCTSVAGQQRGFLRFAGGTNSYLQGNYIGISPKGDALGSLAGTGRGAINFNISGISGNILKGNTISNADYGLNLGGNDATTVNNTFRQNKIYGNAIRDITFNANSTVFANDPGDVDSGANNLMNYPVIEYAEYKGGNSFLVHGSLDGKPSEAPFTIEVCRSSNHSSSHGGCLQSLGLTTISSPGSWEMTVFVDGAGENNLMNFSSLATNANGSTSEFSANVGGRLPIVGSSSGSSKTSYSASAPAPAVIVTKGTESSIILSGTLKWDAYFDVVDTPKPGAFRIPNTTYWQVGPKKEIWWKATSNNARILPSEVLKPYILIFKYDPQYIEPSLRKGKLRIAYSTDGIKWKLLSNTIHNSKNNTLAIVTKQGGFYMLVAGYP